MKRADTYNDIREINLAYLMLAQNLIRDDRAEAMLRLGIDEQLTDILANLTPGQVLKMASSDVLICRFRFDDNLLIDLLSSHDRSQGVSQMHSTIIAAGKAVETINDPSIA